MDPDETHNETEEDEELCSQDTFENCFGRGKVHVFPLLKDSKACLLREIDSGGAQKAKRPTTKRQISLSSSDTFEVRADKVAKAKTSDLDAEACEVLVTEQIRQALESRIKPTDHSVFILHNRSFQIGSAHGETDIMVIHRTLGLLFLEVKAVVNLRSLSRLDEAAGQLLHARTCILQEMEGLAQSQTVSLAIAAPNLRPEDRGVILQRRKRTAKLTDHPEIGLLLGCRPSPLLEWLQGIRGKVGNTDPFTRAGEAEKEGDLNFRKIVTSMCSVPNYGEAVLEYARVHEKWILTPEQMNIRNSPAKFLHIWGPPGAGKTLLLIHRACTWLTQGRPVVVAVGDDWHDVLLKYLGKVIVTKEGSKVEDRLRLCRDRDQLFPLCQQLGGRVCLVVDEFRGYAGCFPLFSTILGLVEGGFIRAMWTADTKNLLQRLPKEAQRIGVQFQTTNLPHCLRCPREIVAVLNSILKPGDPNLEHYPFRLLSAFMARPALVSHMDHAEYAKATPFYQCRSCQDAVTSEFTDLGLPLHSTLSSAHLGWSDCIILWTGWIDSRTGMYLESWLRELGVPAVWEGDKIGTARTTTVSLPTSPQTVPQGSTDFDAWRTRVIRGQDSAGKPAVHIVWNRNFVGLEKRVVFVFHHHRQDFAPDKQTPEEHAFRLAQHRAQWVKAISRCQGKLIVFVASPSPLLPVLSPADFPSQ